MSDAEFWRLTPRLYAELMDRYVLRLEREDFRSGLICSLVANIHRKEGTRAFKVEDFMTVKPKYRGSSKPKQSPETMLKLVEMLNAGFAGTDQRKKP